MTENQKQLTLEELQKIDDDFDARKTITVGDGYVIDIDERFRPTKIVDLINEMLSTIDEARTQGIEIDSLGLVSIHLIKHFTSLTVPSDFAGKIRILGILIDNDFFAPIMSAFHEDELRKVSEGIARASEGMANQLQLIQDQQSLIAKIEEKEREDEANKEPDKDPLFP